jgi:hypothetical protein
MTTTKTFLIINRITVANLGLFLATSEDDAVAKMIRDAGYRDAEHEAEVLQSTPSRLRDELRVTEIDVPEAAAKLAAAMVEYDRECADCADVSEDADAADCDHWDLIGVGCVAADKADVHCDVARAIVRCRREDLREAYAKAWREAVEADLAEKAEAEAERQWETGYDAALTDIREGRADGPAKASPFPKSDPFYNGICENYAEGYNAALAEAAEEAEAD